MTAAKVKNRSPVAADFKSGQLALGCAARADDQDPPATLRDPFLTCTDTCSAQWSIYIDDKAVPDTGVTLSAPPGESDGRTYHTLYGVSLKIPAGKHTVRLARTDSGGVASVGQISSQLGAIQLSG